MMIGHHERGSHTRPKDEMQTKGKVRNCLKVSMACQDNCLFHGVAGPNTTNKNVIQRVPPSTGREGGLECGSDRHTHTHTLIMASMLRSQMPQAITQSKVGPRVSLDVWGCEFWRGSSQQKHPSDSTTWRTLTAQQLSSSKTTSCKFKPLWTKLSPNAAAEQYVRDLINNILVSL